MSRSCHGRPTAPAEPGGLDEGGADPDPLALRARDRAKPSESRRLVCTNPGLTTSDSATRPAIACTARFTDTRAVVDDTNAKIDWGDAGKRAGKRSHLLAGEAAE